ncbi:MAG TPA: PEP/pyruvate-binding domain-containing protein [Candidatus Saccharimonadales bacterium]|nr:PEP/pyruvate-binding domain-containing protein [Candidatus Saccharimonadales bacterium]
MLIIPLHEATDGNGAGGKAASLGTLLRAGFRVPPGFVVIGTPASAADIKAVLRAFDHLGTTFVAVRSSAIHEDGREAAWAGQLDTFLNVTRSSLLDWIQACADSAQSARAQAYAAHHQVTSGGVAVIVQAMVASEISGVAFSAHPVTGSREQFVIEAGLGLGEAIVSGEITPDTYVIEAASGAVSQSVISQQTQQLTRGPDGANIWKPIEPAAAQPKLSTEQLAELTSTIRKLADFYSFPIDIEWAYANDTLYLLQARPITTL